MESSASTLDTAQAERAEQRKVIFGSALGTAFEWYDFLVFGTLAAIIGPLFFSKELGETGGFLAGLATFGAGLILRPFGSLLFGRMGDTVGRKTTFMVTMALMGVATAGVGLLPTYETAGVWAPILLVTLRCIQGLALGGEYGGAVTYVAEHAPAGQRGRATGWIQICASLGFFLSLVVVLSCQTGLGEAAFKSWGWRLPFLFSIALLGVSMYIRARLRESPVFLAMKAQGNISKAPLREAFGRWANAKYMILSLFGAVAGVGIVWYTGQFYVLIFLQKSLKVDLATSYLLVSAAILLAVPFFVVFGALSDRIGRKKMMLFAFLLASLTYIPIFKGLTHYANPALERAITSAPVVVEGGECSVRAFSGPVNPCDKAQEFLNGAGVPHRRIHGDGDGKSIVIRIGAATLNGFSPDELRKALTLAGYPAKADPAAINKFMVVLLVFVLSLYVCMAYGPIAAYLVELFPARVRYSSVSMPYHIGTGYFGGFLLYFATLISTSSGDIYAGLYYPIGIALMSLVVGGLFLPETRTWDINR